jgi:hypothetical protein
MSDGLRQIDEMPVSVSGSLASVEDAAIVITNGARTYWIPRDQVRLVSAIRP